MAGQITASAPHLDGSESIGVWFDLAWSVYVDIMLRLDTNSLEHIEGVWEDLAAELDENGKPRPEDWGTSEKAQQGQAAMMAMFGGGPEMGMAPNVGDEG